jgi:hypothetical protein
VYNYRITSANLTTHIKVTVVGLLAGVVIAVGGLVAAPKLPDMSTRLEARAPVLKAGKPVIWSSQDKITIR